MKIGKVSEITGLSKDTLRYYEKLGLLHLPKNTRGENNYRQYDAASIERLFQIKQLKSFGFTLNEIKDLNRRAELDLLNCKNLAPVIHQKIAIIDAQIAVLETTKGKLKSVMVNCKGNCGAAFNAKTKNENGQ